MIISRGTQLRLGRWTNRSSKKVKLSSLDKTKAVQQQQRTCALHVSYDEAANHRPVSLNHRQHRHHSNGDDGGGEGTRYVTPSLAMLMNTLHKRVYNSISNYEEILYCKRRIPVCNTMKVKSIITAMRFIARLCLI